MRKMFLIYGIFTRQYFRIINSLIQNIYCGNPNGLKKKKIVGHPQHLKHF